MSDEQAASTLTLVAAILALLVSLASFGLASYMLVAPFGYDPYFWSIFLWSILILPLALGGAGFIFAILWFSWRNNPSVHKTGLIVSGVLGLFFAGFLPGLLALIAGAITPTPSAYIAPMLQKPVVSVTGIHYCSACGQAIDNADTQFCPRCGSAL